MNREELLQEANEYIAKVIMILSYLEEDFLGVEVKKLKTSLVEAQMLEGESFKIDKDPFKLIA